MSSIALDPRSMMLRKLQTQTIPEICAFFFVMFMTAQVPEVGPLLVVAQMGLFALLIASRPGECLKALLKWWPLMLTPILAFVSFTWSDLPAVSARYGFQLLFTAYIGVILATLLPPSRFLAMSFLSMFVFCVLSIISQRQGFAAHGMVLVGFTGSKNQMALAGFALMLAAAGTMLDPKQSRLLRLATIPAYPIALYIIAGAASATAVLIAGVAAPALAAAAFAQRLKPAGRVATILGVLLFLSPIAFIWTDILEWINRFMIDVLDKDPTLTGRTYLWAHAEALIERRPVFGYGYQAFWLGGSVDAVGLLRWAEQTDGRQFHFHNTFLQIGVDTGYIGMAAFVVTLIVIGVMSARQFILTPTVATSYFFVNFIILAMLAMTELILAPLLPRTMLLYACAVYAFWSPVKRAAPKPAWTSGSWRNLQPSQRR
ncbi:MAG: O-antigen ligase family protein [Terricaulis sp.]